MSVINAIDGYKVSHRLQYEPGTEEVVSNWTPRSSRDENVKEVVFFGLQYFIKKYLQEGFQEFFDMPEDAAVSSYARRIKHYSGEIDTSHIKSLHRLGYLPIEIRALPEGTLCPIGVPMFVIRNTNSDFFWLTNYLETILSCTIWGPCTSATTALQFKKLLTDFCIETNPEAIDFVNWQGHDFSFRGMFGYEAAQLSGAGHLLSFTGTDTIPAIDFMERYYNANAEVEMIGGSVNATEHSVMCLGSKGGELATFRRLLTEVHPTGILSIVSDTWDLWRVLTEYLPELKDIICSRDGKLVIRPDSGDPIKIICGDPLATGPAQKGVVQLLWDLFGGTLSSTGFKVLSPCIGTIYGDGCNLQRTSQILHGLRKNGFASTNTVFGIGSYTYQYTTRDQYGFAMKATYGVVNGKPINMYKDPVTDTEKMKKSARGLLCVFNVNGKLELREMCDSLDNGELKAVYLDGRLLRDDDLRSIRSRVNEVH